MPGKGPQPGAGFAVAWQGHRFGGGFARRAGRDDSAYTPQAQGAEP